MSSCIRCGKSTLMRGSVKLKDEIICAKCFKDLGFDKSDMLAAKLRTYSEIKNGRDAYVTGMINRRAAEYDAKDSTVILANYGQERDLVCTEEEREMFNWISARFPDDDLRLVRVSDNYVTVKRGEWDIVRMKFTNRAKWLSFPVLESASAKHQIDRPAEIEGFEAAIKESIEHTKKYED